MKLKKMLFKKIFFKVQFYPPSKKKILIYDAIGAEYFEKFFFKKDFEIFYNRYEKINFFILAKVFIKSGLNNIKKNYKYYYISYVSPKIIITFVDNNPGFYLIKEKFPEIIFISIQNGLRNRLDFLNLKKGLPKKKLHCDYILVLSKNFIIKFREIFTGYVKNIGSFKLNFFSKKNISEEKSILFISQTNKNIDLKKIVFNEILLIKYLNQYCIDNNLDLTILLKGKNLVLKHFKKEFNDKVFNKINYIIRNDSFSNYKIIKKFKLVCFAHSTLGLEAFGLGKKIAALPLGSTSKKWRKANNVLFVERFGYPGFFKNRGFFWSNTINKYILYKIIDRVLKASRQKWDYQLKKNSNLITYNYQNTILKKIIKKHINVKIKSFKINN
jgi:surface carbohydrate biosynthesis protein